MCVWQYHRAAITYAVLQKHLQNLQGRCTYSFIIIIIIIYYAVCRQTSSPTYLLEPFNVCLYATSLWTLLGIAYVIFTRNIFMMHHLWLLGTMYINQVLCGVDECCMIHDSIFMITRCTTNHISAWLYGALNCISTFACFWLLSWFSEPSCCGHSPRRFSCPRYYCRLAG